MDFAIRWAEGVDAEGNTLLNKGLLIQGAASVETGLRGYAQMLEQEAPSQDDWMAQVYISTKPDGVLHHEWWYIGRREGQMVAVPEVHVDQLEVQVQAAREARLRLERDAQQAAAQTQRASSVDVAATLT